MLVENSAVSFFAPSCGVTNSSVARGRRCKRFASLFFFFGEENLSNQGDLLFVMTHRSVVVYFQRSFVSFRYVREFLNLLRTTRSINIRVISKNVIENVSYS